MYRICFAEATVAEEPYDWTDIVVADEPREIIEEDGNTNFVEMERNDITDEDMPEIADETTERAGAMLTSDDGNTTFAETERNDITDEDMSEITNFAEMERKDITDEDMPEIADETNERAGGLLTSDDGNTAFAETERNDITDEDMLKIADEAIERARGTLTNDDGEHAIVLDHDENDTDAPDRFHQLTFEADRLETSQAAFRIFLLGLSSTVTADDKTNVMRCNSLYSECIDRIHQVNDKNEKQSFWDLIHQQLRGVKAQLEGAAIVSQASGMPVDEEVHRYRVPHRHPTIGERRKQRVHCTHFLFSDYQSPCRFA